MKHNIIKILGVLLLLLTIGSCRKDSDTLMSYDHNDNLVFSAAEKSYAAIFNIIWNGLNQNYAIWDYEAEHGLDWDAVYDEFYPQFEALDHRGSDSPVTDDELKTLLQKCLSPLHDGHLYFNVKNPATGSFVYYAPSRDRVDQKDDHDVSDYPINIQYYTNIVNGEIETDDNGNPIVLEYSTDPNDIIQTFAMTPGMGFSWIMDQIQTLSALTSPTDLEAFQLQQLKNLQTDFRSLSPLLNYFVPAYNQLQVKYNFLNIPGFEHIDAKFLDFGINVKYALLKGNIAYFRLSMFQLSEYLDDKECQKNFDLNEPATVQHVAKIRQVWQSWFNCVQQLHKNGTLGGVIIDIRGNGGGNMSDSEYVVGSLLPPGNIKFGYQRYKRGTGRYDYSPMMPAYVSAMNGPHEVITEPVVILANGSSISMSETSILCLKTMSNGTFIGKPTYGAICPMASNDYFSYNYEGYIGVNGVTPVFCNVPFMASYTLDGQLVEGKGITPDIDVALDLPLLQTTGRDTQIDRALQFIRTGK